MEMGQMRQILCIQINALPLGKLLKMSTNTVSREIKYLDLFTVISTFESQHTCYFNRRVCL